MNEGIFESAIKSSENITDVFFTLDHSKIIVESDHEFDEAVSKLARVLMFAELEHGALDELEVPPRVRTWVDEGRVVAIDGTEAANFEGKGACDALAVAVATLAGSSRFEPVINITRAQARVVKSVEAGSLAELVANLAEMHSEQSWTTTYREWCERRVGMDAVGFAARIFDGPLITQNLATQETATSLLGRVVDGEGSVNLGVIKDTRIAEPFTRLAGMALRAGEYLVVPLRLSLEQRAAGGAGGKLREVIERFGGSVCRVVYKPTVRAFAVECRADHWRDALAVALASAAKQHGYELPYQLIAVDSRLRRLFPNAKENARRILASDDRGIQWLGEREER